MAELDGEVALVTGAGRNIGRAVAVRLARAGADVVVNVRANEAEAAAVAEEIRALGRAALPMIADVADREQVDAMVARALERFGRIDVLVNAAAIRPHRPFLELTAEDWERVRSVILDGAVHCTHAVLRSMVEHRHGRVLFVVGDGAWAGGAGRAHVSAAKMGLVGLCRSLATEFAGQDVRLNVISPGRIDTTRDSTWYSKPMNVADGIPLGRLGTVDDIADACLFLVSDASRWLTGQTLHVNGGSAFF